MVKHLNLPIEKIIELILLPVSNSIGSKILALSFELSLSSPYSNWINPKKYI